MTTDFNLYDDAEADYTAEPVDIDPAQADALSLANWHMREIGRIRRERAELVSHFEAEIARLNMRLATKLNTLAGAEEWHARPVRNLHRALREADDTRTSITLAHGTMRSKRTQAVWEYPDEAAFVAWAQEHYPELVKHQPVTVTGVDADVVLAALDTLGDVDASVTQPAPVPDKAAVKQVLVLRDAKGKKVLRAGIDPATNELPPGLAVTEGVIKYDVDTGEPDA